MNSLTNEPMLDKMRLRWAFEQDMGIFNHKENDAIETLLMREGPGVATASYVPFAAIAMHEAEKPISVLNNLFEKYIALKVFEKTGIKWEDFCNMPWDEANRMIDVLAKVVKSENAAINDAINNAGKK